MRATEFIEITSASLWMIISTTDHIPLREVSELLGVVTGSRTVEIWHEPLGGLKAAVGVKTRDFAELMRLARSDAFQRMQADAQARGADAVINVRFTSHMILHGTNEVLAYGTAVRLKDNNA